VTLDDGDRVLLKNQSDATENGIYVWNSVTQLLTRARDALTFTDGTEVTIGQGTTQRDTKWIQTTDDPITVGSSNLVFSNLAASVVTDHGGLSGLADDDHTQYQLRSEKGAANGYAGLDASAEVSDTTHGDRSGGTLHAEATSGTAGFLSASDKAKLNASGPLTTSVDPTNVARQTRSRGVSTDAARADHLHDTSTGAPGSISDSTNSEGTSSSLSRSDHVHAHDNRSGGSLHAAATTSVAGFMSAADKTNLDDNVRKLNDGATVDPGATHDSTRGYAVGSLWVNTSTETAFICVDATPANAVWVEIGSAPS
jgi:hypothetical protein